MTGDRERPCAVCGATGLVVQGAGREATVGTVAALLEAGWLVACPAGHRTPPDAGSEVADEVAARLPQARRRPMARADRCTSCDAALTMPVRRTERPVSVTEVPGLPVTTVVLDVPSTRCGTCSTDQVPTRSVDDVRAAVVALFAADAGGV
ncbi:hypothetical protein [Nitriliruptor alkaliphilus]|uniref:hypothetical protein n=1 Tax=Nitriliruptor alkaliphilus TaxID=427918 RepID=UPI0006967FB3|nr:hypothetical protein [Nitriliruptor alkaliphilus]